MDFPSNFIASLFYFTWGVGAFYWFLNFSKKGIGLYIIIEFEYCSPLLPDIYLMFETYI